MNFSQPCRYMLFDASDMWSTTNDRKIGYVYMSSMPSKEDILQVLQDENQLNGISEEYINNLIVVRPNGWYYKKIEICSKNDPLTYIWKFEPAP